MKKYFSIMIIGAILSTSLCSCAGNTDNASENENEQATTSSTESVTEKPEDDTEEMPTEVSTEPLTDEENAIVQVTKDYIANIEKLELDALADLYTPDALAGSNIYNSLKQMRDDACNTGIAADDYEAIWEFSEMYDDIKFNFNNYATCEISDDTAKVEIEYEIGFYSYKSVTEYCTKFKFPMTKIDNKWYINGDPNYEDTVTLCLESDFSESDSLMDSAESLSDNIESVINNCYNDIQNDDIEKYNVESAELITVADAVKVYGKESSFNKIGIYKESYEKYAYEPYWYKNEDRCVFVNRDGVNPIDAQADYNDGEIIPLSENKKPSSSVYVVDLFN